eukprot:c24752_g1_i1.p1 GENE.c24752_g1_i1~~c24752_g1_i1.p1  ORF type:complete len:172 (-),score=67.53 c24752_g1_i1:114-629(-)
MFFIIQLEKNILLEPRFFGSRIGDLLTSKVTQEMEGTCTNQHGFIICVYNVTQADRGRLQPQTGSALFKMSFNAVVFKPFRGEVLDAVVSQVIQYGFYCEAGPARIYVSRKNMPSDMKFEDASIPAWVSEDGHIRIQVETVVRLRVIGTIFESNEIFCIGTINADYLGTLE